MQDRLIESFCSKAASVWLVVEKLQQSLLGDLHLDRSLLQDAMTAYDGREDSQACTNTVLS